MLGNILKVPGGGENYWRQTRSYFSDIAIGIFDGDLGPLFLCWFGSCPI